ncbi:MAG: DegV family EDD domain-containing protein, partial [Ruminiclostridium sp.]|nr:DegV family EDD domain-containing protein [Ruminiclostridium sp.]
MAVQFIIDSASDILPGEAQELGLIHLPLTVLFGEETYRDAVDLTHEGFYEKLVENDVLPTTSQISPGDFSAAYEKVVESGDEAVVITLSGKLSGTWQNAVNAAEEFPGRVFVVDGRNVTITSAVLAQYGLQLLDEGNT